jgi:N-carbamoylputrescine amidase
MIQQSAHLDKDKNVDKAERLVKEAVSNGARLVCLQEMFNTIYFPFEANSASFDLAEPISGPTITRMRELARQEQIVLVAPIFEIASENRYFNTAAVIDPSGELMGLYRKSSIPLVSADGASALEKYYFTQGDTGFRVFDTPLGIKIGLLICYDRHFPEAARVLALRGADVIMIPTASPGFSRYMWDLEVRSHAAFNLCYVGGVNRVGVDEGDYGQHHYGSSLWADPTGKVVSQAGDESDEIVYADIDLSIMTRVRRDWGFFRDRRPDLYGDLVGQTPAALVATANGTVADPVVSAPS